MLTFKGNYANQGKNRKRKRRVDIVDTRDYEGPRIDPYEAAHIRQIKIVKPWPQTLSPKPLSSKPKTKGPWADTKML